MANQNGLLSRMDSTGIPLLLVRLVLGGLFTYMGLAKISNPADFLKLMEQYRLLPTSMPYLLNMVAVVLPWVEALCGVALLLGVAVRGAGLVSAAMLVMFTPMILLRGLELYQETGLSFCQVNFDCGCGAGVVFLCSKLVENSLLFLLAIVAIVARSRRYCLFGSRLGTLNTGGVLESSPVAD